MGVEISSEDELKRWLEGKPRDWAQVIALRAALQVLPIALDPNGWEARKVDLQHAIALLRSVVVSSTAAKNPSDKKAIAAADTAAASVEAAAEAADDTLKASVFAARLAISYATTLITASIPAFHAAAAAEFASNAVRITNQANDGDPGLALADFWAARPEDCERLTNGIASLELFSEPLWSERPDWFNDTWGRAAQWLSRPENGFAIWREWYFGRLEGLPHAFDRFDAAADEAFYRWIIGQDDDWWNREPAIVNADIAAKVVELRRDANRDLDDLFGKTTTDFFISYTSANEAAAREVAAVLDDLGKTYIVQFRDFAQQNFVNAMNEGLAQAERMIALYSPEYLASGHCMAEWNVFYNRDPSSVERRIVAFKLEDVDLKPLMKPIVYRDLSRLTGATRQAAIREWIIWEPPQPTRAQVEQVVTATLSPQIVETSDGKLDTEPNPTTDQPEYPAELAEALRALRMVLDVALEDASNLPRPMQKALSGYEKEFSANGAKSSWGGLDRLMNIIAGGLAKLAEAEFAEGHKEALEQLIAAHDGCMAALKNADKQLRELSAIPLNHADQSLIKALVDRLKEFFERLRNLGLTRERLDQHVDDLIEQGRDFTFEAGEPDADKRPHARRQYLLYVGGFGLAALNALGSMASISAVPLAQEAIAAGQAMVEVFFRMVGL